MSSGEVFVDAGGYDGDTTEEFSKRYPNYKKVFLFEPSLSNLNKAKLRLNHHHSIEFFERGLSNTSGYPMVQSRCRFSEFRMRVWFNSD